MRGAVSACWVDAALFFVCNRIFSEGREKEKGCKRICNLLWVLTDSNRRPSACKADALNQLS